MIGKQNLFFVHVDESGRTLLLPYAMLYLKMQGDEANQPLFVKLFCLSVFFEDPLLCKQNYNLNKSVLVSICLKLWNHICSQVIPLWYPETICKFSFRYLNVIFKQYQEV